MYRFTRTVHSGIKFILINVICHIFVNLLAIYEWNSFNTHFLFSVCDSAQCGLQHSRQQCPQAWYEAPETPVTQSTHFSHCYNQKNDTGASGFTLVGCFFLQAIKTIWTLMPNNCHTLNPSALDFITLTLDSSCTFISLHLNLSNTLWALTGSGSM